MGKKGRLFNETDMNIELSSGNETRIQDGLFSGKTISKDAPVYEPPLITSYTSDQIIEQIGPAQACSPEPCAVGP